MTARVSSKLLASMINFNSEIITLTVGEAEPTDFQIHRSALEQSSLFFQKALGKEWAEGQARSVVLPEDDPHTLKLYLSFLYSQDIPYKTGVDHTEIEKNCDARNAELDSLANLYVFGEKYMDSKLKNTVIDELLSMSKDRDASEGGWHATGNTVDIIFRGTPKNSPIRRLIMDQHLDLGHEGWLSSNVNNNLDFLLELSAALMIRANKHRGEWKTAQAQMVASQYHEH